ncbi:hypothetical protein PanWU01x14_130820 [Parasponia andersonii]|uniref:Uncharacterized protein n=1 Tax=Parasponia andersonii TaxID=3476 RepID=A0A2P5CQU5_PARAD|nr:hypothetical protein PanWU01x14_130820 [Parasponia andersonii]
MGEDGTHIKWSRERPSDKGEKEGYQCSERDEIRERIRQRKSGNREREMNSWLTEARATMVKTLSD